MTNQHEQYENARKRTKQKKRLYFHFILFCVGAVFIAVINKVLGYGEAIFPNWYLLAILIWGFFLALHVVNVYITNRFFNKDWERLQTDKILKKHDNKVAKLEKKVLKEQGIKTDTAAYQKSNQIITIIAAAAKNNEIGKDNKLIWHLSDDLKRFKKLTSGHAIIMGRKTFESFPKALPNRTNVVITRDKNYTAENAVVVHSLQEALEVTKEDAQPFIIGGGEIYKQALSIAHRVELTRVHHSFEADTYFPELNKSWKEVAREDCFKDDKHDYDYSFITYERA
jgi:dihydrofolate reductase